MCALRLVSDAVAEEDFLDFDRYVDPIIEILTDPDVQTPFTIGLFGGWGSGKSTVLRLIDARLEKEAPDRFLRVQFNPWLHRNEPNMLVPLLHTLHDTLDADPKNRFKASAGKLTDVLLRMGADVLLKHLTLGAVKVEDLEKLEEKYLKQKGRVESEVRRLRQVLQNELDDIRKNENASVIFFVDDLDRCDPTQIVDVIESLKLFFDLRNAFIILAVDKEVIDRGIEVKYSKFQFGARQTGIGAEYIEKMVQLPFQLFPIFPDQVEKFIRALNPPQAIEAHIPLLASVMAPNPRKIKRVLNTLYVIDNLLTGKKRDVLTGLKADLLLRLAVMQIQSASMYAEISRAPDLLLALEAVYGGKKKVESNADWAEYGTRREAVQKFCTENYQAASYLATLFDKAPFSATDRKDLERYLAMMGS